MVALSLKLFRVGGIIRRFTLMQAREFRIGLLHMNETRLEVRVDNDRKIMGFRLYFISEV